MDNQYNGLLDLEGLLLNIEDREIREIANEAIKAYNVGAYRSSINAIWNAIFYDAYKKAKFLSENFGDNQAKQLVSQIENAIKNGNYLKEFDIIENYLYKKFGVINEIEKEKLYFIKKLRNYSSHPTFFAEEGKPFAPNAEDTRMCIRNAIEILLSKKPILGKSAIDHILTDLNSNYTPIMYDDFKVYFQQKYISRADRYLLRNLFVVVLKEVFNSDNIYSENDIKYIKFKMFIKLLLEKNQTILNDQRVKIILNNINDNKFNIIIDLAMEVPEIFYYLEEIVPKIKKFVLDNVINKINTIIFDFLIKYYDNLQITQDEFIQIMSEAVEYELLTRDKFENILDYVMGKNPSVIYKLLELFIDNLKSLNSFASAERFIFNYSPILKYLKDKTDLEKLFNNLKSNKHGYYNQILNAGQRVYNICIIINNLPKEILRDNKNLIDEFLEYLKTKYHFEDSEIKEIIANINNKQV